MLFDRWLQRVLPWRHPRGTWQIRLNLCILRPTRVHNRNGKCKTAEWIKLFMAALRSRCGHYIFALWFLLSSSAFFPRLISAVAEWMLTILLHMVWPYCEFRMQAWNVLHAARSKLRTQKWRKKSPSRHRRTNFLGFATKAYIDNRKKLVKQQYLLHMS